MTYNEIEEKILSLEAQKKTTTCKKIRQEILSKLSELNYLSFHCACNEYDRVYGKDGGR